MNRRLLNFILWIVVSLGLTVAMHWAIALGLLGSAPTGAIALAELGPAPAIAPIATVAVPLQLPAAPVVKIHYDYYAIRGETAIALRQQMSERGPQSLTHGRRYDARTDWSVRWNYRYRQRQNRCALTSGTVQVDVTYILPRWQPVMADPALVRSWEQYMTALKTHEIGHKNHGVAAGVAALQTLSQVAPQPSCAALETAANAALRQAIARYNQQDLDYDHLTRHGATQGAIFPAA